MSNTHTNNEFDAIVVGSGTSGATIARELSQSGKKVLILEKGSNAPLKDTFLGIAGVANEIAIKNSNGKIPMMGAVTTGGSSALYFAVADIPPVEKFQALGIDLSAIVEDVKQEVPLAELPDNMIGNQAWALKKSADQLNIHWRKKLMMIDQSKVSGKYSYEARWKARSFIEDAVKAGVTLTNQATAERVIIEANKAIGVEYKVKKGMFSSETRSAFASKVIVSAGTLETPMLLHRSGLQGIVGSPFFCDPNFALFGLSPDVQSENLFTGAMNSETEELNVGDANLSELLYKMVMLTNFKLKHFFNYEQSLTLGVMARDSLGGSLGADGKYQKEFTEHEKALLQQGEEKGRKILENAGAKHIFRTSLSAAHIGGVVRFGEHLDANLETPFANLHVCDGSILPENVRNAPTLTLVCLGKYLAKQLLPAL